MDTIKYKIVFWFFTHFLLRRIGKRYPNFFNSWIADITDSRQQRRIMKLRYTGDTPIKFETIAIEMGISTRRVLEHHKKVIDRLISD